MHRKVYNFTVVKNNYFFQQKKTLSCTCLNKNGSCHVCNIFLYIIKKNPYPSQIPKPHPLQTPSFIRTRNLMQHTIRKEAIYKLVITYTPLTLHLFDSTQQTPKISKWKPRKQVPPNCWLLRRRRCSLTTALLCLGNQPLQEKNALTSQLLILSSFVLCLVHDDAFVQVLVLVCEPLLRLMIRLILWYHPLVSQHNNPLHTPPARQTNG